jgi:predicted phage terminase large subunit-like protein
MLAGTEVLWPGNKSYYDLMVMREQEGSLSFDSEMQNEPINSRDCLFNTDDFHYWDEKYPDEAALIKSIGSPQFYAACDPSLGKSKTHGDFSAIIVGVYDSPQQILYVLDVDMERRQPENLMETILGYVKCRKIQGVIFESNGFQQMLVDELRNRASQHQLSLNLTPVENHGDKLSRIQALEPFLKTGKIQFSRKHRALIEQLKYFPKGMHDDGPDALEMLFQGLPKDVDWAQMNKGLTQLAAGLERDSFERRWRCY